MMLKGPTFAQIFWGLFFDWVNSGITLCLGWSAMQPCTHGFGFNFGSWISMMSNCLCILCPKTLDIGEVSFLYNHFTKFFFIYMFSQSDILNYSGVWKRRLNESARDWILETQLVFVAQKHCHWELIRPVGPNNGLYRTNSSDPL